MLFKPFYKRLKGTFKICKISSIFFQILQYFKNSISVIFTEEHLLFLCLTTDNLQKRQRPIRLTFLICWLLIILPLRQSLSEKYLMKHWYTSNNARQHPACSATIVVGQLEKQERRQFIVEPSPPPTLLTLTPNVNRALRPSKVQYCSYYQRVGASDPSLTYGDNFQRT